MHSVPHTVRSISNLNIVNLNETQRKGVKYTQKQELIKEHRVCVSELRPMKRTKKFS